MDITAQAVASLSAGQRAVPGTVELVTDSPIVLPRGDGLNRRFAEFQLSRPWLMPSLLLGLTLLLLLRRGRA